VEKHMLFMKKVFIVQNLGRYQVYSLTQHREREDGFQVDWHRHQPGHSV
jgi:hypothetical protein